MSERNDNQSADFAKLLVVGAGNRVLAGDDDAAGLGLADRRDTERNKRTCGYTQSGGDVSERHTVAGYHHLPVRKQPGI